jgi:hypothetical protein
MTIKMVISENVRSSFFIADSLIDRFLLKIILSVKALKSCLSARLNTVYYSHSICNYLFCKLFIRRRRCFLDRMSDNTWRSLIDVIDIWQLVSKITVVKLLNKLRSLLSSLLDTKIITARTNNNWQNDGANYYYYYYMSF